MTSLPQNFVMIQLLSPLFFFFLIFFFPLIYFEFLLYKYGNNIWTPHVNTCLQISIFDQTQGVVLTVLAALGIIQSHHFWLDVEHIEEVIQNVLVCLEMVVFSVLQQYAYHVSPYSGDVESKFKLNKKDK